MKKLLKLAVIDIFKFWLIYSIMSIVLRTFEFFLVKPYFPDVSSLFSLELEGYFHDVFKFTCILFFILPLYALVSKWSRRGVHLFMGVLLFALIMLSFMTIQYYIVSFAPLDRSFYDYSLSELVDVFFSSGDIKMSSYIVLFGLIVSFVLLYKYVSLKSKYVVWFMSLLWIVALPNVSKSHVRSKDYGVLQDFYLVKNKAIFFLDQSLSYFTEEDTSDTKKYTVPIVKELAKDYASLYSDMEYVLPQYPLLRKNNDEDVLGKYFEVTDSVPNIVFLFLEGMGRNVCGPGARYGSYTPFIDSLIEHSLYWENFLSNAERTYGVMPNVLGSLPFGSNGFHNPKPDENIFPGHQTIISYLKDYGYRTGFYYGGWKHFTNYDGVLNASGIDYMIDSFDIDATKIRSDKKGFSWGYDDMSLIKQYLRVIDTASVKTPRRLDVILTVSLHAPFMPPNEDYYFDKLAKRIDRNTPDKKEFLAPYKKPLATTMYVDEVVAHLIKEYKKREDYKNTIFIMCGDHNIHAFPDDNDIRKYHIPLIIFSPMLKHGEKFSAVGSHQDIAPSLLAFLQANYPFEKPKLTHMLSTGLDTHKTFRVNKTIPLFKGSIVKFSLLDHQYYINDNKYFELLDGMNLSEGIPEDKQKGLDKYVKVIEGVHDYTLLKNRIIPAKYLMKKY